VGLVGNLAKASCAGAVRQAASLIRATGRKVLCDAATASLAKLDVPTLPDILSLTHKVDLVLVFGGDGTMLGIGRELARQNLPLVGINQGRLGFITDLPVDRYFAIGGPGSFPGLELGELRVSDYWSASGSYLWKIKDIMSIRGQALYAGIRLTAGQTFGRLEEYVDPSFDQDDTIYGGSLYIAGRELTPAKARILLILALQTPRSRAELRIPAARDR